jgi:toxin ParE1/3/4
VGAADGVLKEIERKLELLSQAPMAGRPRPELAEEVLSIGASSYVIFYRVLPQEIQVLRVLHGARDIANPLAAEAGPPGSQD